MEEKKNCPKCGSDEKIWYDFIKQYSKEFVPGILMNINLNIEKEKSLDGKEHDLTIDFDICEKCNTFYAWRIYKK